jgi:hypothetical protein
MSESGGESEDEHVVEDEAGLQRMTRMKGKDVEDTSVALFRVILAILFLSSSPSSYTQRPDATNLSERE